MLFENVSHAAVSRIRRAIGMIIGVPRERKAFEKRVALTPEGTATLSKHGHTVLVEKGAGKESGFADEDYKKAGATIVNQRTAWSSELVLKVKEPLPREFQLFYKGQILFTYLHLAPNPDLTSALVRSGVTAIDYATVQLKNGSLPLLKPMSEISGRLAIQIGAELLCKSQGILLGGTSSVPPAHVLILGGGTVGVNAAETAIGMDARVTVLESNRQRVEELRERFRKFFPLKHFADLHLRYQQFQCEKQDEDLLKRLLPHIDILVGAALIPGAKTPHLVTRKMVQSMKKGAIIIDVSIDQGGCVATSRPTDHKHPTFVKYGVTHYCVTNIPASVPRTSTLALTNATLPFILELANKGLLRALAENDALARGLNIHRGKIAHPTLLKTFN